MKKIFSAIFIAIAILMLALPAYAAVESRSPTACNGQWGNCTYAFADNTNKSTSTVTSSINKSGVWNGYGFSINDAATINSVKLRADFFGGTTSAFAKIRVSGDGGATYGPVHVIGRSTSEKTIIFDITSDTSWTGSKLSDSNFVVNATCYRNGTGSNVKCNLDWIPVNVTYTLPSFEYSVSVNPASTSVHQTEDAQTIATVNLVSGITQTVTLSSSCITGASCMLNTSTGSPTYDALLTVSTSASTPAGNYQITVNATNGTSSRQTTFNLTVTDSLPVADASADPTSGNELLNVQFNATVTGGDAPFSYLWDFKDGTNSTSQNPSHAFSVGTYNVSLTVTDSDGDASTDNVLISVSSNPSFDFDVSLNPSNGSTAQNTSITSTVSVTLVSGTTQNVDLSVEGCPSGVMCTLNVSSGSPAYNALLTLSVGSSVNPGTYNNINVTATNGTVTHKASYSLTVTDNLPVADASADPTSGGEPLNVQFNASVVGGDAPFSYLWDFKDGTNSTSQNPSHAFSVGTYNVSLKITDNDGDTSSDYVLITVNSNPAFDFSVSLNPSNGSTAQNTSTTSTVTVGLVSGTTQNVDLTIQGCPANVICAFNQSNGNPTYNALLTLSVGANANPGAYVINVTGSNGTVAHKASYSLTVTDGQPIAGANASPSSGTAPLTVNFDGSVSGGNAPFTYLWNFKDGSANSSQQDPQHNYTASGTYNVSFTVTDNDGDSSTAHVVVTVNDPFDFSVSATPSSGNVSQGANATTTINVTLVSGSPTAVSLSAAPCITNATCIFSPNIATPSYSSTMTVVTQPSGNSTGVAPGTYVITVVGTDGTLVRSANYTLTVA